MSTPDNFPVRIGHYIEAGMVPFFAVQILLFATGLIVDVDALLYLIFFTVALYMGAAVLWWPKHGRGLCEACFAAFPLNAPDEATRIHRWLRWAHAGDDAVQWLMRVLRIPQAVFARLAAGAVVGAAGAVLLVLVSPWLAVVGIAGAVVALRAGLLHQRFSPWCPWCRRGPGDEDREPAPDHPDPVAQVR